MTGTVTILYFAALRERMGKASETVPLDGAATVAELVAIRRVSDPMLDTAFSAPGTIRVAVNKELKDMDAGLHTGDELAFFPPMTGG